MEQPDLIEIAGAAAKIRGEMDWIARKLRAAALDDKPRDETLSKHLTDLKNAQIELAGVIEQAQQAFLRQKFAVADCWSCGAGPSGHDVRFDRYREPVGICVTDDGYER